MIKRLSILALVAALSVSLPVVAAGTLDGKTFHGTLTEHGKKHGNHDAFEFKNGMFRSTACESYGFGFGEYKTEQAGDAVTFTARTVSKKEGTMDWTGTVKGDEISGTAVWTKSGQAPVSYTFAAKIGK